MKQLFRVTVDNKNVTDKILNFSASEKVGSVYHTGTLEVSGIDVTVWLYKSVEIEYGLGVFKGFVYSFTTGKSGKYSVSIRSNAARLTEPFETALEIIDAPTDSRTLVGSYGYPVKHSSAILHFGGSYERNGTPLDAIRNIAAITKADVYDTADGLVIEPLTSTSDSWIQIREDEYFNYLEEELSIYNANVSFVTITSGATVDEAESTSSVTTSCKIYVEMDEVNGEIFIYSNPTAPLDKYSGMYFPEGNEVIRTKEREEHQTGAGTRVFTLNGAIYDIVSVTSNGANVTDYHFAQGYNKLWFDTLLYGDIVIKYVVYYSKAIATTESTPDGNFVKAQMFYCNQFLLLTGFIVANNSGESPVTEQCKLWADSTYYKNDDIVFFTIGVSPVSIILNADETSTLLEHSNGIYTRGDIAPWFSEYGTIDSIMEVEDSLSFIGVDGAYSTSIEGITVNSVWLGGGVFTDYEIQDDTLVTTNPIVLDSSVLVRYNIAVKKHFIPAPGDDTTLISIAFSKCGSTKIVAVKDGSSAGDGDDETDETGDNVCALFTQRNADKSKAFEVGILGTDKIDIVFAEDPENSNNRIFVSGTAEYNIYKSGDIDTSFVSAIKTGTGQGAVNNSLTFETDETGGVFSGISEQVPDANSIIVHHGSTLLIQGIDYIVDSNDMAGLKLSTAEIILFNRSVSIDYTVDINTVIIPPAGVENKASFVEYFLCTYSAQTKFDAIDEDDTDGGGESEGDTDCKLFFPSSADIGEEVLISVFGSNKPDLVFIEDPSNSTNRVLVATTPDYDVYTSGTIDTAFLSDIRVGAGTETMTDSLSFDTDEGSGVFSGIANQVPDVNNFDVWHGVTRLQKGTDYTIISNDAAGLKLSTISPILFNRSVSISYTVNVKTITTATSNALLLELLLCAYMGKVTLKNPRTQIGDDTGTEVCRMFFPSSVPFDENIVIGVLGNSVIDLLFYEDREISMNRVLVKSTLDYNIYTSGTLSTLFIENITVGTGTESLKDTLTFDTDEGGGVWSGIADQVPDTNTIKVYHGNTELVVNVDYSVVSNDANGLKLSTTKSLIFNRSVNVIYTVSVKTITVPPSTAQQLELFLCTKTGSIKLLSESETNTPPISVGDDDTTCRLFTASSVEQNDAIRIGVFGGNKTDLVFFEDRENSTDRVLVESKNDYDVYASGVVDTSFLSGITVGTGTDTMRTSLTFDNVGDGSTSKPVPDIDSFEVWHGVTKLRLGTDYAIVSNDDVDGLVLHTDDALLFNRTVNINYVVAVKTINIPAPHVDFIEVLLCSSISNISIKEETATGGDGGGTTPIGDANCSVFLPNDVMLTAPLEIGVFGTSPASVDLVFIENVELTSNRVHVKDNIYVSGDIDTSFVDNITTGTGTAKMRISLTFASGTGTTTQVPDENVIVVWHGSSKLVAGTDYTVVSNTGGVLTLSTSVPLLQDASVSIDYEVATSTLIIPALGLNSNVTAVDVFGCSGNGTISFSDITDGEEAGVSGSSMTCIMPDVLNYVSGFTFMTHGGDPEINFLIDGNSEKRTVFSESGTNVHKEEMETSLEDGVYYAAPTLPMQKASGAKSYGADVPYKMDKLKSGETVFTFGQYYPSVKILYVVEVLFHTVEFDNVPDKEVIMSVLNRNTGRRCNNTLEGADPTDPRSMPCELPATFVIDLAAELSCDVSVAANKEINNPTLGTFLSDAFGEVNIVLPDGTPDDYYTFLTQHIVPRSKIIFEVNIGGTL